MRGEMQILPRQSKQAISSSMEGECNTTIGNLESKVKSMEQESRRIVDDNRRAELLRTEERKSHNLEEEKLEEKCRQQQLQIQELQTKLTDLLDAHIQLEQLQDDTESALHDQQDKLRELNVTYESSVEVEQEEKEIFRIKWMDAQRQLELESARLHRMLNETTSQYEALLEEERGKAHEWKGKWEAMNDEQSRLGNLESSSNSTDDQPNGSAAIEQELKEATTFKADAINRIQSLVTELSQQKEQYESSSARNEEQQQQQLQKSCVDNKLYYNNKVYYNYALRTTNVVNKYKYCKIKTRGRIPLVHLVGVIRTTHHNRGGCCPRQYPPTLRCSPLPSLPA